ncbi:MAG: LysM peptidoglycan-binding domain-containing protein [Atopobiaceae bacterium]|nr:LysM peptidoglycan-binding domain-containing protein [Atopobiaceae bacterium]
MYKNRYGIDGTSALRLVQTRDLWLVSDAREERVRTRRPSCCARSRKQKTPQTTLITSLACALMIALVLVCMVASGLAARRVSRAIQGQGMDVMVVVSGDTLWSIATQRAVRGCTTSELISWIKAKNDLPDSRIFAGQRLVVPCRAAVGNAASQMIQT